MLTFALAQGSTWLSDLHTYVDLLGLLAVALMSFVGYKVHALLFSSKIMERVAALESTSAAHEKRIDKLDKKVFGV